MNPWVALLIGIVIGWILKWIFDSLTRQADQGLSENELSLQKQLSVVEVQNSELKAKLKEALNREPEIIVKEVKVMQERDRLQQIKGIGNVFAKRLNEAGIFSFADLATKSPKQIEEIIKPESWQKFNYDEWTAAALELEKQKQNSG